MTIRCVIVADGTRARFFSQDPEPASPSGPMFIEQEAFVVPELARPTGERYSAGRSESHGHVSGHGFALDDHRDRHDQKVTKRFAAEVARTSCARAREYGAHELIVVADPKMLGVLRPPLEEAARSHGLTIKSVARELSKRTAADIEENLRHDGLIPARRA